MKKKTGLFQLITLALSAVISLKSLPLFAETGFSLIFFLIIAMLLFFIPISMVLAELNSTWPSKGGCYIWLKKAYGESVAFFVMWSYWMQSIIWFPTILSFIMAMLAYTLSPILPNLNNNIMFYIIGIIFIFFILTYINLYGLKTSAVFSSVGIILGTILPTILIIFFGIKWIINGNKINILMDFNTFIPALNPENLVFFAGILLGISGIEVISFHSTHVEKPAVNIPKAIITSSVLIFFIYILGSLSIAIVIPKNDICLASGIIQALKIFFVKNNIIYITPFISFFLLIGSISSMNTWIMGPIKGIHATNKDHFLPHFFKKVNKNKAPINLLITQAIIGSAISIIFSIFIDNINGLIWIFTCLAFQFASIFYIMLFLSVIKLRKKYPNKIRIYTVPYVKLISLLGILICVFTFITSYTQPININIINKNFYFLLLSISFVLLTLPALIFIKLKQRKT
ncbi:MAG: amino acid permease [Candidatus Riesia sp.]|nr:amino acid permease [Candidatus Riesia sp.]